MRRRVLVAVATGAIVLGVLKAFDSGSGGFVQPVPSVIALRDADERLEFWTGTPCAQVSEIELTLDPGAKDPLAVVDYVADEPRTVNRFELGTAPAGFTARTPLPEGISWRAADDVLVIFTFDDRKRSVTSELERLVDGADAAGGEPDDYLLGRRFLSEDEVLDGDGDEYALVCSPDPTAE